MKNPVPPAILWCAAALLCVMFTAAAVPAILRAEVDWPLPEDETVLIDRSTSPGGTRQLEILRRDCPWQDDADVLVYLVSGRERRLIHIGRNRSAADIEWLTEDTLRVNGSPIDLTTGGYSR